MSNSVTNQYRTRSQLMKVRENTITENVNRITYLEEEIKDYKILISGLQIKLSDKEKLINILTNEQEENAYEYEKICKENTNLKRQMAKLEAENSDIRNDVLNLTELNQTLTEENDEVCIANNSYIVPLKSQVNEMHLENNALQIKLAEVTKELHQYKLNIDKSECKFHIPKVRLNIYRNRKLERRITKLRKKIRKLQQLYNKSNKTINKSNGELEINGATDKIQIMNKTNLNITEDETTSLEKETKLRNGFSNDVGENNKPKNNCISKLRIVGDNFVRGLGVQLLNEFENKKDIYCSVYGNASFQTILKSAHNIVKKENNLILVIILNSIKQIEITSYQSALLNIINEIKDKNIKLICTNIPYEPSTITLKTNESIFKFNSKMNSLALFNENIEIINICDIKLKNMGAKAFKEMMCYYIASYCKGKLVNNEGKSTNFPCTTVNQIIK